MLRVLCLLLLALAITAALFWLATGADAATESRCRAAGGNRWCYTPSHRGPKPATFGVGVDCRCLAPDGAVLHIE